MTIAPTRTGPLYDLSHRALSLGDGEVEDLLESLSTSSALAESWAVPPTATLERQAGLPQEQPPTGHM